MKVGWLVGIIFCHVILTVVSGISEGTYFGSTGLGAVWDALTAFKTISLWNPVTAVYDILVNLKDLFIGLFEIITWKYSFFTGPWAIFRWLMFSISTAVGIAFILALRGTSSG